MDPCWPYYVFLISWVQCIIVVWFAVTIETQSTDGYSSEENSSSDNITDATKEAVTFINIVMPTCPPPDNLHLLCDVTLGGSSITCKARALIIEKCYSQFMRIYNNSEWNTCLSDTNFCQDIVNFLADEDLIQRNDLSTSKSLISTETETTAVVTTSGSIIHSTELSESSTSSSSETPLASNVTLPVSPTSPSISDKHSTNITSSAYSNISFTTQALLPMEEEVKTNTPDDVTPTMSYVYPILGVICIICEVIILCYIFCYRKKKLGSPVGRYRRTSTGSMVVNEDVVEPETTSPTKALCTNAVHDDEFVLKEDQRIFNSYLNLRFIDESSVEGTPEKSLIN